MICLLWRRRDRAEVVPEDGGGGGRGEGGDGGAAHGDLPSRPAGDVEGRGEVRKLTVRSKLNIMAGLG